MQIEDRYERWHPFDPAAFDGTQLIYPGAHADRFPPDSRAAALHAAFAALLRRAYTDLVASSRVRRYWDTGDRDGWEGRILAAEVLPGYLELLDPESHEQNKEEDTDYRAGAPRLRWAACRMHVDIPDALDALREVAAGFTPELPESDDRARRRRYHFRTRAERRRLARLRDRHLEAIDALRAALRAG